MNDISEDYMSMLSENGVTLGSSHYKKHLKLLIKENVPGVEFVKPHRLNESEQVMSSRALAEAVDNVAHQGSEEMIKRVADVAKVLRGELLNHRDTWHFAGSMSYENPPMVAFFLKQLLFGTNSKMVCEKRDDAVNKTISIVSQILVQNVRTNRQVKHKPKSDVGFVTNIHTPLSVGLALCVHNKVRSKELVNHLSDLHIGTSYKGLIELEKRVECAVVERMSATGGYCLPQFVKKGRSIFFAVDNIDFLEATCDGQNTLHGTVVVVNQEDTNGGEFINKPLQIPDKVSCVKQAFIYHQDITIDPKPIKFPSFVFDSRTGLLKRYNIMDRAWMLASHFGIESKTSEDTNINTQEDSRMEATETEESSDAEEWPTTTQEQTSHTHSTKKLVMPTWSATNSLIMQMKDVELSKTNSEVVAPLFRQAPTDYATLYTVLELTQNISAVVMGPDRKTVITLDLDLYERAIKIQSTQENTNWVLRAGELHICFAALHAIGKYVEESGLDNIAVEKGIYSPTTLRQIFGGKAFKRGVEYHMVNALACYKLRFQQISSTSPTGPLTEKCQQLREGLHNRDRKSVDVFDDICEQYSQSIEPAMTCSDGSEVGTFLVTYTQQVECLLNIIRACRQGDWEEYLAALDKQIKYFFAHDLYKYARLMPLHLAQMNELQTQSPETWKALKEGDFCVKKTGTPFANLFVDQTLEQEIRRLKVVGGITGLTQNESALNRFLLATPELTRIVTEFQHRYSSAADATSKEHYQLTGTIALRIANNAEKIRCGIEEHCGGSPFVDQKPLVNLVSMMAIPDAAKNDILNRDEKGQARYEEFVRYRMTDGSQASLWDRVEKLNLKTYSTLLKKATIAVGNKVVKLREDRQLLARFLVIQQSRPQLVDKLAETIGNYEMAVIPRSLFATDGTLLIPSDKSLFMKEIEQYSRPAVGDDLEIAVSGGDDSREEAEPEMDNRPVSTDPQLDMEDMMEGMAEQTGLSEMDGQSNEHGSIDRDKVIIIDGQAVVQSMTKLPGMDTICDLGDAFVKRINGMMRKYAEGRVIFDRYITGSLKEKTRAKRAGSTQPVKFIIQGQMSIRNVSMKLLLSHTGTKSQLTEYFGKRLLDHFAGSDKGFVVVYGTSTLSNKEGLFDPDLSTHTHEEADTQIPLHVLDATALSTSIRDIYVWSPDTDVFLLLIDLVATCTVQGNVKLLTGRGKFYRTIDVKERCVVIGSEKSKALIGLHNFTGADWGGKFFNISKKTWITKFLALTPTDDIVGTLRRFGSMDTPDEPALKHMERFICNVYSSKSSCVTVVDLRWELFKTKNFEGEKLPPTQNTLKPHIQRVNFISRRDKSYKEPRPILPHPKDNGWEQKADGKLEPVRCLDKPAPQAVLELVKCGCKGSCHGKANCSCHKNGLSCTALCKCADCRNIPDYRIVLEEDL